ncbi:ATP-dependent DNA helicase DinG [Thalassotalea ponticola]|uniref:ATP-dependent DNA helicase DinG n=1 Tax=Thalassotalea ponticola TaxID=1523392 RepID=UPI0025B2F43E|nr:ATP-dependent DNA helicase DinG [Thalassotalea ponticola]MDN3651199.1 ATP-dependent DNA helicase DinG [Thalassotalea ponticola]
MLGDKTKESIRSAYKRIGESLENFSPRKEQAYLIAEIAKTIAGEYDRNTRHIVIEAGTGTGKSLAYCLGSIPIALKRKKKVIISTATVALQEQLVNKDLPFLLRHSGLAFEFCLVKGRQRYVCAQRLALANHTHSDSDSDIEQVALFERKPTKHDTQLLKRMHKALVDGKWQGDRDSWPTPIANDIWQYIQSDKHSCLRHLDEHAQCPFHRARDYMDNANVLVVNHSLLLADLELGGGKILTEPEDTIYIIDEAHHLPDITRDHASAMATVKGAVEWLQRLAPTADRINKLATTDRTISPALKVADLSEEIITELRRVNEYFDANQNVFFGEDKQYRFENGVVSDELRHFGEDIANASKKCFSELNKLYNTLLEEVKDGNVQMYKAEPLLAEAGFEIQRVENLEKIWSMYAKQDSEKAAPLARWIEKTTGKRDDYLVSASPIDVGFMLQDNLWDKCDAAVLCSATLCALNSFDHFRRQVGLGNDDGTQYKKLNSPFDYQQNAVLTIPKMQHEPNVSEPFTLELISKLPSLLRENQANLVLFSSYWQMEAVANALREKPQYKTIQVQGEQSRQAILNLHKERCDQGKTSIIFGSQSFSEGLDLPGKYLTNLIITKLPFSVPTSPVDQAHAEYIKHKGGNPFMLLSVPDASKKLVQSCGRLLRNEKDTGMITILDRRLVSKRYGKDLLDSLPPYRLNIEY